MEQQLVKRNFQVSSFYAFFLIHSTQTGVGILTFQSQLAQSAGTDGWISILAAGAGVNFTIWMIYKIFAAVPGDIVSANQFAFGKKAGAIISHLFTLHFTSLALISLSKYINVIHIWMFPEIPSWCLAGIFFILSYYVIAGGFRTINGFIFFSVVLSFWLIFVYFYALEFANFHYLLPVFNHSLKEIGLGTKDILLSMLGFEAVFVFYPFLRKAENSQKFVQWGALFTTVLLIFIYLVTYVFYSQKQLVLLLWPTLTMTSIIELPFLQRFEIISVSWWAFLIVPNLVMTLWASSRIIKRTTRLKQKHTLLGLMLVLFLFFVFYTDKHLTDLLENWILIAGGIIVFGYTPILLLIIMIKKKAGKSQ